MPVGYPRKEKRLELAFSPFLFGAHPRKKELIPMQEINQDGQYYAIMSTEEVLNRFGRRDLLPIEIGKSQERSLKTNLIIPPLYQAYSVAIQYMSNWFYKRFDDKNKEFFKHKYLDLSHVMDQMNHYPIREIIKNSKPSAHIMVEDDTEYDRNGVDLHNLGLTLYNNKARYKDAFFIDRIKNTYISLCFMELHMEFNFSIRVATKSVQDDIFAFCEMAFRAGGSEKHYIDMDYPIPPELIGQIACDAGLCNEDNKYDVHEMLHYFNQRSKLALLYKFNQATGNMEYFIRIPKCRIHLRTSKIQKQQGQLKGMIYNDFVINFRTELFFPSPKFFAYYSLIQRDHIKSITALDTKSFLFGLTKLCNIPPLDEHGWPWEFRSTYQLESPEELKAFKNKELISISIDPLFIEGLREAIEATKQIAISPSAFINIMAFNYLRYIPVEINWCCMKLNFLEPLESQEIHLVIYVNKEFLHTTLGNIKQYKQARLRPADDRIGPGIELGTKTINLD